MTNRKTCLPGRQRAIAEKGRRGRGGLSTTFSAVQEQTELEETRLEHRLKSGKVNAEVMNRLFK